MKRTILALSLAAVFAASAEMKIGTVNMLQLVRLHPSHETNRNLIKSTDKDYKAKLDGRQDALKAIAEEGKKAQEDLANPMLSAAAKAEAQKKLESVQQRFMTAQQDLRTEAQHYQNELSDLESRLLKLETEDIRAKISAFAKQNGYDLVLDVTTIGYAKDSLDVTDEILKALGVDPKKRTEKKDADK
jgi:Skp family chaperone for outer membrane proteins